MPKNDDRLKKRIQELETRLSGLKIEAEESRLQKEEEAEKKQYYQLIADFTFGWELWLDPGGTIKYCSPSCFDLTGFTSNQIINSEGIDSLLVFEADRKKYLDFVERSLDQMLVNRSLEFRIMTRTKQLRWCSMNVRGVYNKQGKYLGVRASIQDITKLKRAMGHIHELEAGKEFHDRAKKRLRTELDVKERELVSFLLQLSQKNELITNIENRLKNVLKLNAAEIRKELGNLVGELGQLSHRSLDWDMVENELERMIPGFLYRLQVRHPKITQKDKKLCAYIRLGLSSKEISGLMGIAPKSVEIARIRLRKKLNIAPKLRLVNYLEEI